MPFGGRKVISRRQHGKKEGPVNRDDRRNGGKMTWPMVVAGLLSVVLSGCISVPIGTLKEEYYGSPRVTTRTIDTEGKLMFHADVDRKGNVVRLRLMVDGTFVEETTTTRTYAVQKQKLAVGVCPGFAYGDQTWRCREVNEWMGGSVVGIFFLFMNCNVGYLGTPTLSGLFVEPFLPARDHFSFFRQGAFVGFSKYKQGNASVLKEPKVTRQTVEKTKAVDGIALWFDADPQFWESTVQQGDTLVLRGVEAGRHEGKLYIKSVPAGHVYEKELKKMAWEAIDVEIPE